MTASHRLARATLVVLLAAGIAGAARAQKTAQPAQAAGATSPGVDAVWGREQQYWQFVQAGDVDGYRTLWDDGFRGWPCADQHPATKATITGWVRDIRDRKVRFSYDLTREGAADFGDIVVVYYHTPMVYEYPDGRVMNRGRIFKITHTWRRTADGWHILGGMCGEVLPPAAESLAAQHGR